MKRLIIFLIASIAFTYSLKSQCNIRMYDIYTPNGSTVETWVLCESSIQIRAGFDTYWTQEHPNAQKIITYDNLSSTKKFNCHGHAWLRIEQGIDRWIGVESTAHEDIYMSDGSYIEVSQETYPGKISFVSDDHSAVTTAQAGVFISKWGQGPLMQHAWNDHPYNSSNLKYYIRAPSISGPSSIAQTCQGNYTVSLPPGATFQSWSVTSGLTITSDNGVNGCTVSRASYENLPLTATLGCNYLLNGQSLTVQKEITLRINANPFFVYELNCLCGVTHGQAGKQYYFVSSAEPAYLLTDYSWTVYPPGYQGESSEEGLGSSEHSGRSTENNPHYFPTEGYYTIELQLTDGCGLSGGASIQFYVGPGGSLYSVYPNPSSGRFTVKVNQDVGASGQSTGAATQARGNNIVVIQIRTLSGIILKQLTVNLQNEASIDASDLADGLYVLSILKNGQVVESKNIVIKK